MRSLPFDTLLGALTEHLAPEALAWLRQGLDEVSQTQEPLAALSRRFPAALRRLGREALGHRTVLSTGCGDLDAATWPKGDLGRACLLLAALAKGPAMAQALVTALFRQGDEGERAALVRILCLTPDPCALLPLAQEAGRINSLDLFAALALDNPYPAAYYDDHLFNQVVLKSLFNGLPIARISGLGGRTNPELSRMCEDYVGERLAAGRTVPTDIWLALEPSASPRGLRLTIEYLGHPDPGHRYHAALALTSGLAAGRHANDPEVMAGLIERRAAETDPQVCRLLAALPGVAPAHPACPPSLAANPNGDQD